LRETFKDLIKARLPWAVEAYRAIRRKAKSRPVEDVFTGIYHQKGWGQGESVSGSGSSLAWTTKIRAELPKLIADYGVKTLLDAPCGDFNWMSHLHLELDHYTGIDVVAALIEANKLRFTAPNRTFAVGDIIVDPLPRADLIMCRHCFIHLTLDQGVAALRNFKRTGARYVLLTHTPGVAANSEIEFTGSYRPVNMERPPFSFGPALRVLDDTHTPGDTATLALYDLQRFSG